MNYIVFDLEWNQGMPGAENESLPFEIIEIAAVKLDDSLNITDKFQRVIRPFVYKQLNPITAEITGYTMVELNKGVDFPKGVADFLDWCGLEEHIFCSWATQDLKELQMNMRFYGMSLINKPPLYYYDIQKLFSFSCENGDDRRSLKYAADTLKIEEDVPFHRAYADAFYTARIMQEIDFDSVRDRISVDTFIIPQNHQEEIYLDFNTYSKFISMGYSSKEKLMSQKYITSVRCHICKNYVRKKAGWFSDGLHNYYFAGVCKKHGLVKGKIRIRKSADNLFYAIKTIKIISAEEYEGILQKKRHITQKRRKSM